MANFELKDYEILSQDQSLDWYQVQDLIRDPLFFSSSTSDDETQSHYIDKILGLNAEEIERRLVQRASQYAQTKNTFGLGKSLHNGRQTWVGLDPETLQTPYREFWDILKRLPLAPEKLVVDLGAAYGRMGVVLNCLESRAKFLGFEYVSERVAEANRLFSYHQIENANVECVDLGAENFELPAADIYFLYEYGRPDQVRETLLQLRSIGRDRDITVVARGRACISLIENHHPWLSDVFAATRLEKSTIFSNWCQETYASGIK